MTKEQLAAIATSVAGLAHALDTAQVADFQADIDDLKANIAAKLPAKDDGTPFSDDELHQAYLNARAPFEAVLERDKSAE